MPAEVLAELAKAVFEYEPDKAADCTQRAIAEGLNPMEVMDVLIGAIRQVGDGFGRGDLFLPDLIGAAEAMEAAMPLIDQAIVERGETRRKLGTVVIGTVAGDIHTIGKSMVVSMLSAAGFQVKDLGVDVAAGRFIDAVKEGAADILALSALLTSTAPEAKKVIDGLRESGLKGEVKVMVGGGAITQAFAESIGADGYSPTAPGAVTEAKRLLGLTGG